MSFGFSYLGQGQRAGLEIGITLEIAGWMGGQSMASEAPPPQYYAPPPQDPQQQPSGEGPSQSLQAPVTTTDETLP
jgi:hypothetical protein